MKTATFYRLFFVTAISGMLFSCNKSSSGNNSNSESSGTDLQTNTDDVTRVSTESDAAFDDVNTAMSANYTATGSADANNLVSRSLRTTVDGPGGDSTAPICDATITLDSAAHSITITYNGTNCNLDRTRTGSVVITWTAGEHWQDAGAVVTVQFNNLAITRLSDNKTITLNGTHTYTNVSGGSLLTLPNAPAGTTITHTITSSNMSITFDNGAQRNWNVARQRAYTYNDGYVLTTTGTHTNDTTTGISEWGTDRYGNSFQVAILQPRVITEACDFQMTSGEVALSNTAGVITITYGLNASGSATGCPVNGGTYYFELSYQAAASGKTYTFILPY